MNRWLLLSTNLAPGNLPEKYRAKLTADPDDPPGPLRPFTHRPQYSQAITLADQALAKDPELAYAYKTLVGIQASKNLIDHSKLTQNRALSRCCLMP